jgi:hypothetical protein
VPCCSTRKACLLVCCTLQPYTYYIAWLRLVVPDHFCCDPVYHQMVATRCPFLSCKHVAYGPDWRSLNSTYQKHLVVPSQTPCCCPCCPLATADFVLQARCLYVWRRLVLPHQHLLQTSSRSCSHAVLLPCCPLLLAVLQTRCLPYGCNWRFLNCTYYTHLAVPT